MKKNLKIIRFTLFISLFVISNTYGQADTVKKFMTPPPPVQYNAGFDVIIKTNGEIVYGLVKEVGLYLISYQRTDIPDGPIYTMLRTDVYAISYRNQVKEYFNPPGDNGYPVINESGLNPKIDYKHNPLFEQGSLRLGIGFIRSFTKVDGAKNYSSSGSFPAVIIGYDVNFKSKVRLGLQIGFASNKFSKQEYSTYDSTQNNITLKENIFALHVYAKYNLTHDSSRLRPYIIAGLGINTSHIRSENIISFTNNNGQALLVKSGASSVGLGVMARVGAAYYLSDLLQLFLDAGVGSPSVINLGLAVSLK